MIVCAPMSTPSLADSARSSSTVIHRWVSRSTLRTPSWVSTAARTDSIAAGRNGRSRQNSARCARSRAVDRSDVAPETGGRRSPSRRACAGVSQSRECCSRRSHQASPRCSHSSGGDEERRGKAGSREDATRLSRIVCVPIVERDRHLPPGPLRFSQLNDRIAAAESRSVARNGPGAPRARVDPAPDAPRGDRAGRASAGAHRPGSLWTRAATISGNCASLTLQFLGAQFFSGQPIEKRRAREKVAVRGRGRLGTGQSRQEPLQAGAGDAPPIVMRPLASIVTAERGNRQQQYAAWSERAPDVRQRDAHVGTRWSVCVKTTQSNRCGGSESGSPRSATIVARVLAGSMSSTSRRVTRVPPKRFV